MSDISELQKKIIEFRDARNWAQFHNGKDLAVSLSVEASELLELFLWKGAEEVNRARLHEELADVFYGVLLLAKQYDVDLKTALLNKLEANAAKYPVDKAYGSNKKYSDQ